MISVVAEEEDLIIHALLKENPLVSTLEKGWLLNDIELNALEIDHLVKLSLLRLPQLKVDRLILQQLSVLVNFGEFVVALSLARADCAHRSIEGGLVGEAYATAH